jgi:MerR family transcriptional regulator/heat shock protein HspR
MNDQPVYAIGIISKLLNAHPETLRGWERHDLIRISRINGRRFYSESDLKRLYFIRKMMQEGINLPSMSKLLQMYPCWYNGECPGCMHPSSDKECGKPCWRVEGSYCTPCNNENECSKCWMGKGKDSRK